MTTASSAPAPNTSAPTIPATGSQSRNAPNRRARLATANFVETLLALGGSDQSEILYESQDRFYPLQCVLSGCLRVAHLYPVQGPLAAQTPPPVYAVKVLARLIPALSLSRSPMARPSRVRGKQSLSMTGRCPPAIVWPFSASLNLQGAACMLDMPKNWGASLDLKRPPTRQPSKSQLEKSPWPGSHSPVQLSPFCSRLRASPTRRTAALTRCSRFNWWAAMAGSITCLPTRTDATSMSRAPAPPGTSASLISTRWRKLEIYPASARMVEQWIPRPATDSQRRSR